MLMTIGLGPSIVNHLEILTGKVLPPPALGVDIEHGVQAYHQYAQCKHAIKHICTKLELGQYKAQAGPTFYRLVAPPNQ